MPSLFSRPESSTYLGGIGNNHPILPLASDQTLLDISGCISQAQAAHNQRLNKSSFVSQPSAKRRPAQKKPPKTTRLTKKPRMG